MKPTRSANRIETSRRSADVADATDVTPIAATAGTASSLEAVEAPAPSGDAHSPQNESPGSYDAPQDGQVSARGAAHRTQNFRPGLLSAPQFEQLTPVLSPLPVSANG